MAAMSPRVVRASLVWIGVAVIVAPWVAQAQGQLPGLPRPASRSELDKITAAYGGIISWTTVEGDSRESAIAYVSEGEVQCTGSYTNSEGSWPINGAGLLHITLGIIPEGPDRDERLYSFEVACPYPDYDEARWSHAMNSYQQSGGEVRMDPRTGEAILPHTLQGTWDAPIGGEDGAEVVGRSRLTWHLCLGGSATPPDTDASRVRCAAKP